MCQIAQMPLQTELQAELSWRVELGKYKIPKCAVNLRVYPNATHLPIPSYLPLPMQPPSPK